MNNKSRSAITFSELKNKTEDIYEFGNDWGLYIDIEINYHNHMKEMREKKINRIINTLDKIDENEYENDYDYDEIYKGEYDNDKNKNKKSNSGRIRIYTYFGYFRTCCRQLLLYLLIIFGLSFIFENNKNI